MALGSDKLINYTHLQMALTQFKAYIDTKISGAEKYTDNAITALESDTTIKINTAKNDVLSSVANTYVTKATYDDFVTKTNSSISTINTDLSNAKADINNNKSDITSIKTNVSTINNNISNINNNIELLAMPGFKYVVGSSGNVTLVWVG